MARKFVINDDDGTQFEVTEETLDEDIEEENKVHDDDSLTGDEIAALKRLAAKADDILNLLEVEAEEHSTSDDGEEIIEDEEEVLDEDEKETVVKTGDSKRSIGSIQKKKVIANDSAEDKENDIAKAWSDRYNKSYKKGE